MSKLIYNFDYCIISDSEYWVKLKNNVTIIVKVNKDEYKSIFVTTKEDYSDKILLYSLNTINGTVIKRKTTDGITLYNSINTEEYYIIKDKEIPEIVYKYMRYGTFMLNVTGQEQLVIALIDTINTAGIATININNYEEYKYIKDTKGICYSKNNGTELWVEEDESPNRYIFVKGRYFIIKPDKHGLNINEFEHPIGQFATRKYKFNLHREDILIDYNNHIILVYLDINRKAVINLGYDSQWSIYAYVEDSIGNMYNISEIFEISEKDNTYLKDIVSILKDNRALYGEYPVIFANILNDIVNQKMDKSNTVMYMGSRMFDDTHNFVVFKESDGTKIITHQDFEQGHLKINKHNEVIFISKDYYSWIIATESSINLFDTYCQKYIYE